MFVIEVACLMEGEWSCKQVASLIEGEGFVTKAACLMEGEWSC